MATRVPYYRQAVSYRKHVSEIRQKNRRTRMTEKPMDEAEARAILENLARKGPPTAQVASIKVLRDLGYRTA